jgi:hypothetical protein
VLQPELEGVAKSEQERPAFDSSRSECANWVEKFSLIAVPGG